MTSLNFLADLEKDTPLENSVMISNRSLQNAAAEIASLKAELGEAREIIGEFIGPGKFYGEDHGAEGTTPVPHQLEHYSPRPFLPQQGEIRWLTGKRRR